MRRKKTKKNNFYNIIRYLSNIFDGFLIWTGTEGENIDKYFR